MAKMRIDKLLSNIGIKHQISRIYIIQR